MKYSQLDTESHPLSNSYPQFLSSINSIILQEKGTIQPFQNEVALKFDKIKESSDDKDILCMKSVDMVLVIKENNNLLTLLVEFKLDCKNAVNLSESELRDKIKHSKKLLFGSGIPIHNQYIFVFNDNLLNSSRRIISLKLSNASGVVLSINDLKALYFEDNALNVNT